MFFFKKKIGYYNWLGEVIVVLLLLIIVVKYYFVILVKVCN